jgi:hypothetical protein
VPWFCDFITLASACCVILFSAGGPSDAVDVYKSATGTWSTAKLSVARGSLAATSVGMLSLIAGGEAAGTLFCQGREFSFVCECVECDCVQLIAALFFLILHDVSCKPLNFHVR